MQRTIQALAFALLLAAPGHQARAATLSGYTLPDAYPLAGQNLVLNGMGIRTFTFLAVKVYVAGLYVTAKSTDARALMASQSPRVILMQFLHTASKSEVEKQYREGEARNCGNGECPKEDEADFEKLVALTPGAAVGDTFTYIVTAQGLRFLVNNRPVASFPNVDLARRILAGFIGEKPPSQDLKQHLLGLAP